MQKGLTVHHFDVLCGYGPVADEDGAENSGAVREVGETERAFHGR
jgi:hypothetical protein